MFRKVGRRFLALFLSFVMILGVDISLVKADWFDSWLQNRVGADYLSTQQRGYVTFGSLSFRPGTGDIVRLITIEPPRLSSGCGGIDMFLGGISFANFEYIVQRLQRLIQAAPAVAFEIALQILSQQLHQAGINVQGVIDFLNSLQFDECKLVRGLKTYIAKGVQENFKDWSIEKVATDIEKGIKDFFRSAFDSIKSSGTNTAERQTVSEILNQYKCPPVVSNIINSRSLVEYFANNGDLSNLFSTLGISSYDIERVLRSLIGDIEFKTSTQDGKEVIFPYYVPPKYTPEPSLITGEAKVLADNGAEVELIQNLNQRIQSLLIQGYNAKKDKWPLPNGYETLVRRIPIPIDKIVTYAYSIGNPMIVNELVPYVATSVVYLMFVDLLASSQRLLSEASKGINACSPLAEKAEEPIRNILQNINTALEKVRSVYYIKLDEVSKSLGFALNIVSLEDRFYNRVSRILSDLRVGVNR
ncbi:MAG: conjugal transfer protein TraH [Nitrososphaeria archaeon]